MCTRKVAISDYRHACTQYFACGRCPACRQVAADRRSRKIRAHHKDGFLSYFITLTYFNGAQPYITFSDLNNIYDDYAMGYNLSDKFTIPIYRDIKLLKSGKKEKCVYKKETYVCGYKTLPYESLGLSVSPTLNRKTFGDILDSLQPIRYKINKQWYYDFDKISVAFSADAQMFYKRLRQNLYRAYGKRVPLHYFTSPEYGPTTQRYHIHALVWFPNFISEADVKRYVAEAWPYASDYRTKKYVQLAKDPANYLASYVNSSSNVSEFLTENFKLRTSHSLDFGFNDNIFGFSSVFENVKQGRYTYVGIVHKSDGSYTLADLPYPRYILARYFPTIKGQCRLTATKIVNILQNPTKYLSLTPSIVFERDDGTTYHQSNIVDSQGFSINFTKYDAKHTINSINYAYNTYFKPLGFSRLDFSNFVNSVWDHYYTYLYRNSLDNVELGQQVFQFYNVSDGLHYNSYRLHSRLYRVIHNLPDDLLDPNNFPNEIQSTQEKIVKFNRNIKQRKINQFNN